MIPWANATGAFDSGGDVTSDILSSSSLLLERLLGLVNVLESIDFLRSEKADYETL